MTSPIELLTSAVVSAVSKALASLLTQCSKHGFKKVHEVMSTIEPRIAVTIRRSQATLESLLPTQRGDRLSRYFASSELEMIARQMFVTKIVGSDGESGSIRSQMSVSLASWLDIEEDRIQPFVAGLYTALFTSVQEALQAAVDENSLSAHEALSAARHRILFDELATIGKKLDHLRISPLDQQAISDFAATYRQLIGTHFAHLRPPNLDNAKRVPINELFVAPSLSSKKDSRGAKPESIPWTQFLSGLHRVVVLGNPGGGKSTMAAKICYDLATCHGERLVAGRALTPVFVLLREYAAEQKTSKCSILQFIEHQATARYQVNPPKGAFESLILSGQVLMIFDGLDELLETGHRQELTANIEAFCTMYPSVPVLVTSREVGYEQAPLDPKKFEVFRLGIFDDNQVRDYLTKWFMREDDHPPKQRAEKAQAFWVESAIVPDLRTNPLMLGLMCNLYHVEGYIPRNRPDVYAKCSLMLFERWDKNRGIIFPLPFEEHIRPAMEDLAFWIYSSDTGLQNGVTEQELVGRTTEYLCTWVFDDRRRAVMAAESFVIFCTGRAWVFTDTGTTREGERLFQFTHRTFLEYFCACHLVSINPTPLQLLSTVTERVQKGEWDVVLQLAFQIQSKRVQGGADQLICGLLSQKTVEALQETGTHRNALNFVSRTLEFLVPSPRVKREVTRRVIDEWIAWSTEDVAAGEPWSPQPMLAGDESALDTLDALLIASAENRETIADELFVILSSHVASDDAPKAACAVILGMDVGIRLYFARLGQAPRAGIEFWDEFTRRFSGTFHDQLVEIAKHDRRLCSTCYVRGIVRISEIIRWFGIEFLFAGVLVRPMGNLVREPIASTLASRGLQLVDEDQHTPTAISDLEVLSTHFIESNLPFDLSLTPPILAPLERYLGEKQQFKECKLPESEAARFGLICLVSSAVEVLFARAKQQQDKVVDRLLSSIFLPMALRNLLVSRWTEDRGAGREALRELQLSGSHTALLERWNSKAIDFTKLKVPD